MPLERLERRQFMSKVRSALLSRIEQGGRRTHQKVFGRPMGAATTVMSSRGPTAEESTAFEERKKNRALYGKYGKGGLEREKISSTERLRTMMETGQTKRRGMMEAGATERTGITAVTTRRGQDLRFAPGDAFGPPGVERYRAETERMFPRTPKIPLPKAPKVYPAEYGLQGEEVSRPYTISAQPDPETGEYYQVPIRKKKGKAGVGGEPLTVEEQQRWDAYRQRYGLK